MGDPKMLTEFQRSCEDNTIESVFRGVVEGFTIAEHVAPEEFYQTMAVHTEEGRRLVHLSRETRMPFDVGDPVIVIGRSGEEHGKTSVFPIVLLNPKERSVLLSRKMQSKNLGKSIFLRFQIAIAYALSIAWIVSIAISWEYSWLFSYSIIALVCLLFTEFCLLELSKYLKRSRLYHCDEKIWSALSEEIAERFGIEGTM
jgi:hypothetical protein